MSRGTNRCEMDGCLARSSGSEYIMPKFNIARGRMKKRFIVANLGDHRNVNNLWYAIVTR